MNHEIRVVALLQAHPGKAVELEAVLKAAVVPSRAEPGCREYILHVDKSNPECFVFVERWINMAAIDNHRDTDHFRAMSAAAADLLLSRQVLLMNEVPGQ